MTPQKQQTPPFFFFFVDFALIADTFFSALLTGSEREVVWAVAVPDRDC